MNSRAGFGASLVFIMLMIVAIMVLAFTASAWNGVLDDSVTNAGLTGLEGFFFKHFILVLVFFATIAILLFAGGNS
jgi:hypothetical protein